MLELGGSLNIAGGTPRPGGLLRSMSAPLWRHRSGAKWRRFNRVAETMISSAAWLRLGPGNGCGTDASFLFHSFAAGDLRSALALIDHGDEMVRCFDMLTISPIKPSAPFDPGSLVQEAGQLPHWTSCFVFHQADVGRSITPPADPSLSTNTVSPHLRTSAAKRGVRSPQQGQGRKGLPLLHRSPSNAERGADPKLSLWPNLASR